MKRKMTFRKQPGKRGNQEPLEDKVRARAAKQMRPGQKHFEDGSILLVKCGGKLVEWFCADPTKIGT